MNLHEGFQIGARVQINDKENEHRFYGKHGIVIDHPHIWYSKVLCDDGSVWSGNKCYLSLSQRPTMLAPDLGQAARLKVKIQLPQAGNANTVGRTIS